MLTVVPGDRGATTVPDRRAAGGDETYKGGAPIPGRARMSVEITVDTYGPFRDVTGEKTVAATVPAGSTVGDVCAELVASYPELRGSLLTDDGELAPSVNLTKNGTDVAALDGLETPVADGDELRAAPPVVGG